MKRESKRTRHSSKRNTFSGSYFRSQAYEDFNKVRARALVSQIISFLKKEDNSLLAFEEVRSLLNPDAEDSRSLQRVPLSLIVGSEGRYRDFTKSFLPKNKALRDRWTRVDEALSRGYPLPPVALYKLGGVYFVHDGNHRVSVAKSKGLQFIEAQVTTIGSSIGIDPGMSLKEIEAHVRAAGYPTTAADLSNQISAVLAKGPFERIARGVYTGEAGTKAHKKAAKASKAAKPVKAGKKAAKKGAAKPKRKKPVFACPSCRQKFDSGVKLGAHYKAEPSHRPGK